MAKYRLVFPFFFILDLLSTFVLHSFSLSIFAISPGDYNAFFHETSEETVNYFETGDEQTMITFHLAGYSWCSFVFHIRTFDTRPYSPFAISIRPTYNSAHVFVYIRNLRHPHTKIRQIKGIIKITNKCAIFIFIKICSIHPPKNNMHTHTHTLAQNRTSCVKLQSHCIEHRF